MLTMALVLLFFCSSRGECQSKFSVQSFDGRWEGVLLGFGDSIRSSNFTIGPIIQKKGYRHPYDSDTTWHFSAPLLRNGRKFFFYGTLDSNALSGVLSLGITHVPPDLKFEKTRIIKDSTGHWVGYGFAHQGDSSTSYIFHGESTGFYFIRKIE
jgi:hypothetical protein